jgi:hypothetical protein
MLSVDPNSPALIVQAQLTPPVTNTTGMTAAQINALSLGYYPMVSPNVGMLDSLRWKDGTL